MESRETEIDSPRIWGMYSRRTSSSFKVHEMSADDRSLMVGPQCSVHGDIWGKSAWIGGDSLRASRNCLPLKWFELLLSITVNVIVSEWKWNFSLILRRVTEFISVVSGWALTIMDVVKLLRKDLHVWCCVSNTEQLISYLRKQQLLKILFVARNFLI